MLGDLGSVAGNEMCYLGEMLGGYGLVFTPISALRSNFNTALYCTGGLRRGERKIEYEGDRRGAWEIIEKEERWMTTGVQM